VGKACHILYAVWEYQKEEVAKHDIDVLLVSPGAVTTDLVYNKTGPDCCTVEEVANTTFRDLGQEKESVPCFAHEFLVFTGTMAFNISRSFYYLIMNKFADQDFKLFKDRQKKAN
jgi:short-subunit dehydrogenase